jgi:hypothetical protein
LKQLDFPVIVTEPNCSAIRLDPQNVFALTNMSIDYGSVRQVVQDIPEITDEFGLLDLGYCQDLQNEVQFDEDNVLGQDDEAE